MFSVHPQGCVQQAAKSRGALRKARRGARSGLDGRKLGMEPLEDRRLLSVVGLDDESAALALNSSGRSAPLAEIHSAAEVQKPTAGGPQFAPGEILVGFEGEVAAAYRNQGATAALEAAERAVGSDGLHGLKVLMHVPAAADRAARLATRWQLPAGADVLQAVRQLTGRPGIAYAEPNYALSVDLSPDDPRFVSGELWGLHNTGLTGGTTDADIDAPEAWDITTGSGTVVVGVIDTGVDYTHPDLNDNIWTNPGEIAGNGLDDDLNGYVDDIHGYDFVNNDGDPFDDNGHGSHVSGTIGAEGDNGLGVAGINWDVQIMGLKFLDAGGGGWTDDAVLAVDYARTMGAQLTSNSWGGGGFSQALYDAIAASGDANMLFVAAAGNGNTDTDANPNYPSGYNLDNIISVAATDHNDAKASFSNWGAASVDLAAPGVDILSTTPGNTYSLYSGTSMATPHVAGVAALAWGIAGNVGYAFIRDAIFDGVDPNSAFAAGGSTPVATGGRLNAYNTLMNVGMVVSGSDPAAGAIAGPAAPTTFVVNFSYPYNPSTVEAADLTVNGRTADSVTPVDADTVRFEYTTGPGPDGSPVISQGVQTMAMAGGAVSAALSAGLVDPALKAWSRPFRWDVTRLNVSSANPANGSPVTIPFTTLTFDFNEAVDASTVGIDDLILNQGSVTGATAIDADTVQYTLSGIVQEGTLTVQIPAGALADTHHHPTVSTPGNPNLAYNGSYTLDWTTFAYPGVPLEAEAPFGSLIYDPTVSGFISSAGDTDSFTISMDPGQRITVVVDPDASLTPTATVSGPGLPVGGVSTIADVTGKEAVVQTVSTGDGGTFTVTVGGNVTTGGTGAYSLRVIANAAVENESHDGASNNGTGTSAQNIEGSFIPLTGGATRGAVMGGIEDNGSSLPDGFGYEARPVDFEFIDISGTGTPILAVDADDDAEVLLRKSELSGFQFSFYGRTYTQVIIGSNGEISFEWDRRYGGIGNNSPSNGDLTARPQVASIAPFWDDLEILRPAGAVYWQVLGSGASQQLVIQWNKVRFWGSAEPGDISFQAILHESDGSIQFNYLDLATGQPGAEGKSATVGIKDVGTQGANRLVLALDDGPNQWVGTGLSTKIGVGIAPNVETPDYYAFSLGPNQRATLALKTFGGNVDLDLRDSSGNPVDPSKVTRPTASNVDDVIEFAGGVAGTYYAAVLNGVTRTQYNLLVTRGGYFELEPNSGPEPWNGVDPAQSVALDPVPAVVPPRYTAIVLGSISGASGVEATVGYFTDYAEGTTSPEGAILAAGFLPVHITDISTFDFSTIDVLMVNESNNSGLSAAMLGRLGDIQSWVATGGALMVHDRFVTNDAGDPQSNPFLLGAPGILLDRDFADDADIDVIRNDTLVTDGPGGVVDDTTLDGGTSSNHGFALEETFPAGAVSILSTGPLRTPNHVAAFSYEFGSGAVYYSTIPLDFYLFGGNNFSDIYAPNALAYAHSLAAPEVDFYKVEVPALEFGGRLNVSTRTPGDGPGEPSQFLLDPMVRVYDVSGNLLAGDDNGGSDGRNALLSHPLPPAASPRTYYIQAAASQAIAGPARGEYVATIDVLADPPPAGITINKASIVTGEPNVSDSFTVVLDREPTANVSIGISTSDPTEGLVSTAGGTPAALLTLTFTPTSWSTPQAVTVAGRDDFLDDGDISYSIVTAPAVSDDPQYGDPDGEGPRVGLNAADVSAVNLDNDTPGITVSPVSGLITTEAGGTATFTVVLDSEPTDDVTIAISSSDTSEGVASPPSLTFTPANWSTEQTVTVTGQPDDVLDRDVPYTIITAPAGSTDPGYYLLNAADVALINTDDEPAAFVTIEDFEDGNITEYTTVGGDAGVKVVRSAKHDGTWGLQDATAEGWIYRPDLVVQPGDIISWWARIAPRQALAGRAYMGFGATASGAYSIVMAPNAGALMIQKNPNYGFQDLASVPQVWQVNHWYRFEVAWYTGGTIVGRLYDSDGMTVLNTVTASDTSITSGGIAFRAFGSTYNFDTVQRVAAASTATSLSAAAGGAGATAGASAGLALVAAAPLDRTFGNDWKDALPDDGPSDLARLVLAQYFQEAQSRRRPSAAPRSRAVDRLMADRAIGLDNHQSEEPSDLGLTPADWKASFFEELALDRD